MHSNERNEAVTKTASTVEVAESRSNGELSRARDIAQERPGTVIAGGGRKDTAQSALGHGFEVISPDAHTRPVQESEMEELARRFDWACNGGITGLGIDAGMAKQVIKGLNADEFAVFNKIFTKHYGTGHARDGEKWDVVKQLESEKNEIWSWSHLSNRDYNFLKNSIAQKTNEVPPEFRVDGESLLEPHSTLRVGLINRRTLIDGRDYGVYIPKNADSRAPVIVAIKGASLGDSGDIINDESGLTQYAEKLGTILVFPHSRVRAYEVSGLTMVDAETWNVPGYTNIPKEHADTYDDRVYLDNVLDDLGTQSRMVQRVGLFGHSDGARFAQIYAGSRSSRVAAVVALHGTIMEGDPEPGAGIPIKIVHSQTDEILPWSGGMGSVSSKINSTLSRGTNLDKSAPYKQPEIWRHANQCGGGSETRQSEEVTTTVYENCSAGEVIVELKKTGSHSIDDKLNDAPASLWSQNTADPNGDDAGANARWLKDHVVKPNVQLPAQVAGRAPQT